MSMYDHPLWPVLRTFFDEPDFYDGCAFGLPIHMRRNPAKAWCGYVGIPHTHRLHGDNYLNIDYLFDCPGGLTWAEDRVPWGGLPGYWYFGFDCSHYNDITPKDIIWGMAERVMYYGSEAQYRSFDWVLRETRKLAEALSHYEAPDANSKR